MIDSLPLFHRIAGQPVIVLGHGDAADARRRLVERAGGQVIEDLQEGIDKGARLAFIAHDSDEAARGDAIRLRCAGLLVNAADRPELCDFTVPSLLDRAPVLIAVGTGGASAGLAKMLRLRLEKLLPQSLGALACALADARDAIRARWSDAGERRRALDAALEEGGPLDPLEGASAQRVADWLTGSLETGITGTMEIRLKSNDPDELTLREARYLGTADTIGFEPDIAPAILARGRADAVRIRIDEGAILPASPGLTVIVRGQPVSGRGQR